MNGAPRGSQHCGVAPSDGDTQPTPSTMQGNSVQPQTGSAADSFVQNTEISTTQVLADEARLEHPKLSSIV
ncbi:unnamed protein product [Enterobius vermicularis]|uniref:Uncharacterized protein n=1 Tax=Enterobius vermicularis TaxID=51028 RepID=A0A0N4UTP1_ENTVE|nr:unnamed protein product [Enterobius vermicularis]